MKFQAVVQLNGKTATGIQVPEERLASMGASKRPAVRVTIRGYTYRTTVGVMGGRYMIPLSAEHRAAAGVAAGDEVEVQIELDTEPRELSLPADFSERLKAVPAAKRFFESLSYSNRRRFLLNIESAKTSETRMRRIDKAIGMLKEGKI
ncbi:YdeI/OmpD-associated family protein [Alicyclobacillus fodiniaquatilis]|uniref:YdeI/OmpD-associated family protein n=1 Tax=Alicyclobacillus fodiniaquatilis TaxID=1661150 RepID=A0ABW4JN02_9BACL